MAATKAQQTPFGNAQFTKMYKLSETTTGTFAEALIKQSGLPSSSLDNLAVLDNACGTGIVTEKLLSGDCLDDAHRAKLKITCADFSQPMINATRERATANGWTNVETVLTDAMDTKLPSMAYTHILWNFGPALLSDSLAGIRECERMLQPNGVLGITAWEHIPWVEALRPAFEKRPEYPPYPKSGQTMSYLFSDTPDTWDSPEDIKAHFENTGFVDVKIELVHFTATWTLEDFLIMAPGLVQLVATKLWTQEQKDAFSQPVAKEIGDFMREKHAGGTFQWDWAAWVATGRKP